MDVSRRNFIKLSTRDAAMAPMASTASSLGQPRARAMPDIASASPSAQIPMRPNRFRRAMATSAPFSQLADELTALDRSKGSYMQGGAERGGTHRRWRAPTNTKGT